MKPVLPQHQPAAAKAARKQPLESCLLKVGGGGVLWLFLMQLTAVVEQWHPDVLPVAYTGRDVDAMNYVHEDMDGAAGGGGGSAMSPPVLPPQRIYKNNGYLRVSCNGGLNQMRSAICDMVTIARYLNLTLLVPELDKESFWADPSDFEDIFDLEHFIDSLRDEVRIVKELPIDMRGNVSVFTLPPVSWSDETYYMDKILPLFKTHEMVHFNRTDFRLANNGLPIELQKLRCRVNYEALRFTPKIQAMGDKLVSILRKTGPFVVLHLRYEMDMLSFTGCAHGCTDEEAKALTKMRHARPTWREKEIDSEKKRLKGMCPLTPEEVALVLQALGFGRETLIYIAAGEIYGGQRRLASLEAAYPKLVKKEMLLSANDLRPFQNRSSQLAALDYLVSLEGDVFIPTYGGNMAKVVEGHRRSMGFRKTILLDRRQLVELLDLHQNGALSWDQFSHAIREVHKHRSGEPARRNVIERRPKEEDYFHANPHECLAPAS